MDDTLREQAEQLRDEVARLQVELRTEQLRRECEWPGCTATYQADTGPQGKPWSRHRFPGITLCPVHAWGEHYPSSRIEEAAQGKPRVRTACHCGWADTDLVCTRGESVYRWQRHIVRATADSK